MTERTEIERRIAAYLDGAMPEAEMEAFEHDMEHDPALAEAVERFASNDDLLREAMGLAADPAADAEFAVRMGLLPEGSPAIAANDNPPFWKSWRLQTGGAIAAALALALTFTMQSRGTMSPLGEALDSTASGQIAALVGGAELQPVLTFQAGDGRYCREFTLADGAGERSGLACRARDDWVVEAWGDGAAQLPDPDEIALASGAEEQTLDEAYLRLDASDPLQAGQEQALIAQGWASK